MGKTYKSKLGATIVIPIVIVFVAVSFMLLFEREKALVVMSIMVVVFGLIAYNLLMIRYTISSGRLSIKGGFFYNKTIPIETISRISETNNPLSSPAASMDRLEIRFGKKESIIISPRNKQEFIDHMQTINPQIEVKYRK